MGIGRNPSTTTYRVEELKHHVSLKRRDNGKSIQVRQSYAVVRRSPLLGGQAAERSCVLAVAFTHGERAGPYSL